MLLEFFYPGGLQAHRETLLLYPAGLGQAQILHVDSTCKTCGGVLCRKMSLFRFPNDWVYFIIYWYFVLLLQL